MDRHDEWSGSDVAETPSSVAVVDLRAGSTVSDVSSNGGDDSEDWDSGYQRVIRMIRRSRIGRTRRMSLVGNTWRIIILIYWRAWSRWSSFPVGKRLDFIGRMSTSLIYMTGMTPVFRVMIRLWIGNVGL